MRMVGVGARVGVGAGGGVGCRGGVKIGRGIKTTEYYGYHSYSHSPLPTGLQVIPCKLHRSAHTASSRSKNCSRRGLWR